MVNKKSSLGLTAHREKGLGKGLAALGFDKDKMHATLEIEVAAISPNPNQPRRFFAEDALVTLASSIKQYGVVQPIIVQKRDNDTYELIAGERRWRASKLCGLKTIPAIIKNYTENLVTEIALVENLQREDLDAIEEATAYIKLIEEFSLTQEDVAQKIGRSRSYIANTLRLLQLPLSVQEDISIGELTVGQVRPLLAIKDSALQEQIAAQIKEDDLSARQVEALVKRMQNKQPAIKKEAVPPPTYQYFIAEATDRLKMSLGAPVTVKIGTAKNKMKGKIEITFSSEKEFDRLLALLEEEKQTTPMLNTEQFTI